MKVLHIDGGREWGGGQNQVRLLMRELQRAGVEQLCLCPAGSPLWAELQEGLLPVATTTWKTGMDPRALRAIWRRARHFDVLHAHDAHAVQLAILPAAVARRPLIAARRMALPTRALKWNRAARVIAISASVRDTLRASGVAESRIRLIHSGVDVRELQLLEPAFPSLRERLGLDRTAFLAGTVGALVELKGQALLAAAAAHVPDVQWAIVGEGPARARIEAQIREHGVGGRVRLTGALRDARRVLRELDVFVFASEGDALGTSVLDAMACDVPVVAADTPGPGEVLAPVHAATGATLFPPGDAAALAQRVSALRGDGALRQRMIAAQRRRLEDFRIERSAAATLAVYQEVVP